MLEMMEWHQKVAWLDSIVQGPVRCFLRGSSMDFTPLPKPSNLNAER